MSPTSYRAAPPRSSSVATPAAGGQRSFRSSAGLGYVERACWSIAARRPIRIPIRYTREDPGYVGEERLLMSQLYVVLAVIVVALLSVAIDRTIRAKTKTDYLLAGRSLLH